MSEQKPCCIVCEHTSDEIPLIALNYREEKYYICPSHFPLLIHRPENLVGILPGAEKLSGHSHE